MKHDSEEILWNYYQHVNPTYLETASRDKVMLLAKAIKRHTHATDHICEVGLGSGLMLQELSRCREVVGVDLSADAIAYLRSKPGLADLTIRHGDICKLSASCSNMDAVVTIDVIEHLTPEQLVEACHEVHKVL
jgi:2-polyprenyl-3-methyl-5-hydroxy-6-metoxy-1,4-benzoquinol methylase